MNVQSESAPACVPRISQPTLLETAEEASQPDALFPARDVPFCRRCSSVASVLLEDKESCEGTNAMNREFSCPNCKCAFEVDVTRRTLREVRCPVCRKVYEVEYDSGADENVDIPWLNKEVENPEPGHFTTGRGS